MALQFERIAGTARRYKPIGASTQELARMPLEKDGTLSRRQVDYLRRQPNPARVSVTDEERFYRTLGRLKKGETLGTAVRKAGLKNIEQFKEIERIIGNSAYIKNTAPPKKRPKYSLVNKHHATVRIIIKGTGEIKEIEVDKPNASKVGRYWNAVDDAIKSKVEANSRVYDLDGTRYDLETDLDTIFYVIDTFPGGYDDFFKDFIQSDENAA